MNSYSYIYPPAKKQPASGKSFAADILPGKMSALPKETKLAMAYVPFQTELNTYDESKALKAGTLFPCLDKPFLGSGSR